MLRSYFKDLLLVATSPCHIFAQKRMEKPSVTIEETNLVGLLSALCINSLVSDMQSINTSAASLQSSFYSSAVVLSVLL